MAETSSPDLVLANLSWPEVRDIADKVEIVLIPLGSNEQHGPNLSLDLDIAKASAFCRLVSERLYPRVLVAPGPAWGVSFHHMNFPGTITLAPETFIQVLLEIVGSLHAHGFERFLFVNGHGGNVQAMGVAAGVIKEAVDPAFIGAVSTASLQDRKEIDAKHGITGLTGHACETETSEGMYLDPRTVKTDALAPGQLTDMAMEFRVMLQRFGVTVPHRFDEYTTNGALGDARNATYEYGRDLVERGVENITLLINEIVANSPIER